MKSKLFLMVLIVIVMFGITACVNNNVNEDITNNIENVENIDNTILEDSNEMETTIKKYTLSFNNIDATHKDVGHYYDGLYVKLIGNNDFQLVEPEGIVLSGKYTYENGKLICNADKLYGERFDGTGEFEEDVNYIYFFEMNGETQLSFIEMKKEGDGSLIQTSYFQGSIYTLDYEGEPAYKDEENWIN